MKRKGQFMIISAIVASLIVISLSSTMSEVRDQSYEPKEFSSKVNQIKTEAEKITSDGSITKLEERNFEKMTSYLEDYEVKSKFNRSGPYECVKVSLESIRHRAEIPCIN